VSTFLTGSISEQYVGCFNERMDDQGGRILSIKVSPDPGTVDRCIKACGGLGYTYAGLEVNFIRVYILNFCIKMTPGKFDENTFVNNVVFFFKLGND